MVLAQSNLMINIFFIISLPYHLSNVFTTSAQSNLLTNTLFSIMQYQDSLILLSTI